MPTTAVPSVPPATNDLVSRLVAEGLTLVVVTHELAAFADLVTRVVVVDAGLKQVYAVNRSCSKGDPGLLFGPVDMP